MCCVCGAYIRYDRLLLFYYYYDRIESTTALKQNNNNNYNRRKIYISFISRNSMLFNNIIINDELKRSYIAKIKKKQQ